MAIRESFTRRERERIKGFPDVFVYDQISKPLRVQITKTWERFFGLGYLRRVGENEYWEWFCGEIKEAVGKSTLVIGDFQGYRSVAPYFENLEDAQEALDIVDLSAWIMTLMDSDRVNVQRRKAFQSSISAVEAIEEINDRFSQYSLGYELISSGEYQPILVRKDNEYLHRNTTLPALHLLHEEGFEGADDEYRNAHEHYLDGNYKECLVECLKAFESTMKTICNKRGWPYEPNATAFTLIGICLDEKNKLLPTFTQTHLIAVRTGLESGVPTFRHKRAAHGQGEKVVEVPKHYAEFVLHEAAVNIVLLVQAFRALPD